MKRFSVHSMSLFLLIMLGLSGCAGNSNNITSLLALLIHGKNATPQHLTYTTTSAVYSLGEVIPDNEPVVTGTVDTWTVAPALPDGLTLDPVTGIISGTPEWTQTAIEYTIYATNKYGTASVTISITINLAPPTGLSYSTTSAVYTIDEIIINNTPTVTGTVTSWSISPILPSGLTFDTSTGVISGTPHVQQTAQQYTITASNSDGSTNTSISITVNIAPPSALSYSMTSAVYTRDEVITNNIPTVTGTVTSWSVDPELPGRLALDPVTGVISGIPDTEQAATEYTITAGNGYGLITATISITVNLAAPTGLSYSTTSAVYTKDAVVSPNMPTVTGTVTVWSVSPDLPHGLTLNTTTGVITGTPDTEQAAIEYTITASNSSGSTTGTISITVSQLIIHTVAYDGNGCTNGYPPTDVNQYQQGQTITVLGNPGNLIKQGYSFIGWNTQASGNGTTYTEGQTFLMGMSDVILYAIYNISEIIFETSGSLFSPVITVSGSPEIVWTWADSETSNSTNPIKNYGTAGARRNYLRVTPWSSIVRINIGYDGGDGGSAAIEHVADQQVTSVQGLELVAPYLQQWCSSYNKITSLNFSNFTQLDTIECYWSHTLQNVNLTNTPALERACFEDCNLNALDLSQSPHLQDLRGALNAYTTINFGSIGSSIWHICTRGNPQITNPNLFSNMNRFPNILELYIWNDNQSGELIVSSTGEGWVDIDADSNHYTSADFSGALQNETFHGRIKIFSNQLTSLIITGCDQLIYLDACENNLDSDSVDSVLETLDSLGRSDGFVDLTDNSAPTAAGLITKANLVSKGWTVNTD
jgi:hypothetical protein